MARRKTTSVEKTLQYFPERETPPRNKNTSRQLYSCVLTRGEVKGDIEELKTHPYYKVLVSQGALVEETSTNQVKEETTKTDSEENAVKLDDTEQ